MCVSGSHNRLSPSGKNGRYLSFSGRSAMSKPGSESWMGVLASSRQQYCPRVSVRHACWSYPHVSGRIVGALSGMLLAVGAASCMFPVGEGLVARAPLAGGSLPKPQTFAFIEQPKVYSRWTGNPCNPSVNAGHGLVREGIRGWKPSSRPRSPATCFPPELHTDTQPPHSTLIVCSLEIQSTQTRQSAAGNRQ